MRLICVLINHTLENILRNLYSLRLREDNPFLGQVTYFKEFKYRKKRMLVFKVGKMNKIRDKIDGYFKVK